MIIVLIIILSLIFRLVSLNQSLWLDEAVQAITAQKSLGFIFQELSGDFHPPLYHFLMHYWVRVFGSLEVALRMPSVLFGVGTVFILYKIAMHIHGRFVAVLVALFFATAPFHIYYSQEARMYSMTTFFAALSMFYFIKIILESKKDSESSNSKFKIQSAKLKLKIQNFGLNYILYFIATLCLIYSDYYGFLVLLAQIIYLLIEKRYKFILLNTVFLILGYLPWLPMFTVQIKVGILATQSLPGWGKLVNTSFLKAIPLTLIKFTIGRITIFNKTVYALVALGILGILGVVGFKGSIKKKTDGGKIILLWFFVPLIVSWLVSLVVPNYQPFRLLLILPAFYLLLALGIQKVKYSVIQNLLVSLILLINLISLGVYYFNPYFQREDWKGMVKYLKSQPNSIVILPSETSNWPIRYYDPGNEVKMVYGGTGVKEIGGLGEMGDLGDKTFYIRYLVPLFDPSEKVLAELGARGYTKVKEITFNQIPLWEFKKK